MTAIAAPTLEEYRIEDRAYAILRRGDLDERDRLICMAVWSAWVNYEPPPNARELRDLSGLKSTHSVAYRVNGNGGPRHPFTRKGGGLIAQGWLTKHPGCRTLVPGWRLVGMDHGWPLERAE